MKHVNYSLVFLRGDKMYGLFNPNRVQRNSNANVSYSNEQRRIALDLISTLPINAQVAAYEAFINSEKDLLNSLGLAERRSNVLLLAKNRQNRLMAPPAPPPFALPGPLHGARRVCDFDAVADPEPMDVDTSYQP